MTENNFYAPVTPSWRDQRERKQIINKETHTSCHAPGTKKRDREDIEEQNTKAQGKNKDQQQR